MDERKELKVRVSEEEYERLRRVAFDRKMKIQDCLMAALQMWYGAGEGPDSIWATLSKQEEAILRGVLGYIRAKPYSAEKAPIIALFEALGKRYAGK